MKRFFSESVGRRNRGGFIFSFIFMRRWERGRKGRHSHEKKEQRYLRGFFVGRIDFMLFNIVHTFVFLGNLG